MLNRYESRSINSIRNVSVALFGQIIGLIFTFATRIYFIKYLGIGYLGLNGLFSNILSFLSLAEMGFGAALLVSLYKPIQMNDHTLIAQYVRHFKKIYTKIGLFTLVFGIILAFLIPYIIKNDSISSVFSYYQLIQYFLVFLFISVIPYFFLVDRFLIIAYQKKFIVSIIRYSSVFLLNVFQIITLVLFQNFILYLFVALLITFVEFLIIYFWVKKKYPFILRTNITPLQTDKISQIKTQVSSMIFHKITGILLASLPSIFLATFIGLESTGKYSNYILVFSGLNIVFSQIFDGVNASVGNFVAQRDSDNIYLLFKNMFFVNAWLYNYVTIGLALLLQEFISLFFGSNMRYDDIIIYSILINFYINGLRRAQLTFRDAMGLFIFDRNKAIIEALLGLILSYIFMLFFKELGIFIGLTIATLVTCYSVEPYILYKKVFEVEVKHYFNHMLKFVAFGIIAFGISYFSIKIVNGFSIFTFLMKILVVSLTVNIFYLIIYWNNPEFKRLKLYIMGIISTKKTRQ